MNRKTFINNLSIGAIGTVLMPQLNYSASLNSNESNNEITNWLKSEQSGDDYNTFIKCDAIEKNTKIIHISDSHLTVFKNGKTEYPEFAERMNKAYVNPKHYLTGEVGTRRGHFEKRSGYNWRPKVGLRL